MDTPNDDGITLRERLLQVYNSNGAYDKRLDLPLIPFELEYLMGWFWDIRNAIGGNGFGANPISFSEMKAWCELNGIVLSPWEVSLLRKMDTEFIKISNESARNRTKQLQSRNKVK